eukprot:COSAG02_NODE_2774_length_8057_cov_4.361146_8_plen_456_part_00
MADRTAREANPGALVEVAAKTSTHEGDFMQDAQTGLWLPAQFLQPTATGMGTASGGEPAILRLALADGQGEMKVELRRTDSLNDLRTKIMESLVVTIAGAPNCPELVLGGSDGGACLPGSSSCKPQSLAPLWGQAAAAGETGLPLTLKLAASVRSALALNETVQSRDGSIGEAQTATACQIDAERASTLQRQILETKQSIATLRTLDGTATMVAEAEGQVATYEAELVSLQRLNDGADLGLQLVEEGLPPEASSSDDGGDIDIAKQLRLSQAHVNLLSRQLSSVTVGLLHPQAHSASLPLELPTFISGDEPGLDLSPQLISRLYAALPPSLHIHGWSLIYRLGDHGASLMTLYKKVADRGDEIVETVLLIKDTRGYVFGALAMHPWAETGRYYGLGEGMVFKCGSTSMRSSQSSSPGTRGQFQRFGWSRKNDMFQMATKDSLGLGGGGCRLCIVA